MTGPLFLSVANVSVESNGVCLPVLQTRSSGLKMPSLENSLDLQVDIFAPRIIKPLFSVQNFLEASAAQLKTVTFRMNDLGRG